MPAVSTELWQIVSAAIHPSMVFPVLEGREEICRRFAGRATIGFGTTLGGEDEKKPTLVDSVSKLLEKVLASGSVDKKNQLLTLAGVMPSKIYGCSVQGESLVVESAGDYAGGMIGQGDGVKIHC